MIYVENIKEELQHLYDTAWVEGPELEFKSGQGGLPKSAWDTYHLSKRLSNLVSLCYLKTNGRGRGMKYTVMEKPTTSEEKSSTSDEKSSTSDEKSSTSDEKSSTSDEKSSTSDEKSSTSDEKSSTSAGEIVELPESVLLVRAKKWASQKAMGAAIIDLCSLQWMSVNDLAGALDRKMSTIRPHCDLLAATKVLCLKHPENPHHPQQAYRCMQGEDSAQRPE